MYIARESSKLWRRVTMEYSVEWLLLKERWKFIFLGLVFQYLHGLAARAVHYLHRPGPVLQDVGFTILPELGPDKAYISETLFTFMFFSFLLGRMASCHYSFDICPSYHLLSVDVSSFHIPGKTVLYCIGVAQMLGYLGGFTVPKDILFYGNPVTRSKLSLSRVPYGVIYGCGDLIFSSHMIFTLVFVRMYQKYGCKRWLKQLAWFLAVVLSLLIVASRKHYTVDVVVAWYTVNLVVFFIDKQFYDNEIPERSSNGGPSLLPINAKEKDGQVKDEQIKLLNGNINVLDASSEWRQRNMPVNGKIADDGSPKFGSPTSNDFILNGN